jgi:hypothetical protein
VETLLERCCSPNIVVHVSPERDVVAGATDQVLDEALVYHGNLYPSLAETLPGMIDAARVLTQWLREEGLEGPAGFDFVEYNDRDAGRRRFAFAEVNPRINGAAYSTALLERLNVAQAANGRPLIRSYLTNRLSARLRSFADLERRYRRLLFDPGTGRGVVPYTTGRLRHHRCNIAVFGETRAAVDALYEELIGRLRTDGLLPSPTRAEATT